MVVCFNINTFTFEIYHYFQDKWRRKLQFRDEGGDKNIIIEEMVECNGVLFWIAWPPTLIIGYKIQDEGLISPVTVAPLPTRMVEDLSLYDDDEDLHVISMVSYGSSLLLVGIFRHNIPINNNDWISLFNGSRDHLGIVIWELYEDGEDHLLWKWREFARMPAQSLPQISSSNRIYKLELRLCGR